MVEYTVREHTDCPFYWADDDQCSLLGVLWHIDITCPKPMGEKLGFEKDWWVPDACPLKNGPVTVKLKEWNDKGEEDRVENMAKVCANETRCLRCDGCGKIEISTPTRTAIPGKFLKITIEECPDCKGTGKRG